MTDGFTHPTRSLQRSQAASGTRAGSANAAPATTSRQLRPTRARPPTRSPRRPDPRIRGRSVTDGFTYPTGLLALVADAAESTSARRERRLIRVERAYSRQELRRPKTDSRVKRSHVHAGNKAPVISAKTGQHEIAMGTKRGTKSKFSWHHRKQKAPLSRAFLVAGAGFEPATSGL
jgi:hypothetical protein